MFFECQKCGFLFERQAEPSSCPQCGGQFILPKPAPACAQAGETSPASSQS